MSDSEDDRPLAVRPKPERTSPRAVQPARKAPQAADSSSEDDVPLAAKRAATLKKEPKSHDKPTPKPKQEPSSGPKKGAGPAPKAAAKPASGGKAKAELVSKKAGAEAGVKKEPRVKREFGLPGQTRDTPDEADPLRKFYTSLLRQRPESEMARRWCVQFGLLPRAEAQTWCDEEAARKGKGKSSPSKGGKPAAAKRKPAAASSDEDDRFQKSKPAAKKSRAPPASKASGGKRRKPASESESSGDEDSADDFQPSKYKPGPPAARKPAPPAKKKSPVAAKLAPVGKVSPAKVSPAKAARDVAFTDGGLDDGTSSDDDMPLLARARAGK